MENKRPSYGGQAVMDGVMMKGPRGKAIACRKADGSIVYKIAEIKPLAERNKILGWPIVRGAAALVYALVSGIKDLTWSAAQNDENESDKLTTKDIILAVVLAIAITAVFFIGGPIFLATLVHSYIGDFGRSLSEGLLRVALFLGYVLAIRRIPDIRRLFAYHGAEHKVINALEDGAELNPEVVKGYSAIHTRCGTSFILMLMIIMIVTFTFVGQTTPLLRTAINLAVTPLVAGAAFELYRLPLNHPNNPIVKLLVAPGLAMQRLTTAEPDEGQIEVAIAALAQVPYFVEDYPEAAEYLAKETVDDMLPEADNLD